MPRAVLFDVWHTLVYLRPDEEERYMVDQLETVARVLDHWPRAPRARHPPLHSALRAAAEIRAEAARAAHQGVSMSLSAQSIHLARRLGRVARPLDLRRALEELVRETPFHTSPGALETLAELAARGFRLGAVSNTVGEPGEALQHALERAGLAQHIEAWAFSDQLPWTKPSPEIFWHCLGMLATPPGRAVHVGDGWSDLAGAHAAGLRAGILYTGAREYGESYRRLFALDSPQLAGPDCAIARLEALPDVADRLLPA